MLSLTSLPVGILANLGPSGILYWSMSKVVSFSITSPITVLYPRRKQFDFSAKSLPVLVSVIDLTSATEI